MPSGRPPAAVLVLILVLASLEIAPLAAGQSVPQEMCTENLHNPVLNDSGGYTYKTSTGTWFAYNNTYQEPSVLAVSGGLRMWYAGYVGGIWGIYTATSKDGGNWTVDGTPVLTSGPNGTWDHAPLYAPSVLYNGTGYLMYFRASNGSSIYSRSIGVAFSADGIHWKEYADNPVLKPGPGFYDSNWIYNENVIFLNGGYDMWYGAQSPTPKTAGEYYYVEAIDFATSSDGIHWTKYPGNPVFLGASDQIYMNTTIVGHPDVLNINGTLVMLYGDGSSIRYAVSHDGVNWTAMPGDLVDSAQAHWKSDYLTGPAAVQNGTRFALWYYGYSPIKSQSSPYVEGIGLAQCGLVVVQVSTTTTDVVTSTLIRTITSPTTVVITNMETSTTLQLFEGATTVGAVLVIALAFYLLRTRRP